MTGTDHSVRAPHGVAYSAKCLYVGSFHFNATASAYSQVCGVLAGFAFFAIIYLLTSNVQHAANGRNPSSTEERRRRHETDKALFALFCAAFGLAVTTLQYAILAGETGAGLLYGRAASEELMADIALSSSIFTLSSSRPTVLDGRTGLYEQ